VECCHHCFHVDVVVDVEQISPPVGDTVVSVGSSPHVPQRTGPQAGQQSSVEQDDEGVGRRQPE
jgi:hypothetical protein